MTEMTGITDIFLSITGVNMEKYSIIRRKQRKMHLQSTAGILMLSALSSLLMMFSLTGCSSDRTKGYVYYLNYKPEADEAWQKLAGEYTSLTGVEVKIVTAASGSYNDTLSSQMNKTKCPTMFVCTNSQSLENWHDYCYDLRGSKLYDMLESEDYCMYGEDSSLCAIGYCYEAYGLITNISLLEKSGHTLDEIHDFDSLKTVAEDIHSRRNELGFDAFTSSGLDSSSSWRFSGHLANLPLFYEFREDDVNVQPSEISGKYIGLYKNIWDLYIQNGTVGGNALGTATGNTAEEEFGSGRAVFFQNGSWEYSSLTARDRFGMSPDSITMLPIYCGADGEENAGLCCGTENYWAVNSRTDQKNIDATLDFLYWVVSSDTGRKMMAEQFGVTPFKDHLPCENGFLNDAERMSDEGKYTVAWRFGFTPNTDAWRSGVTSALMDYSSGSGEWQEVETAFVNGWKYQYKLEHRILD